MLCFSVRLGTDGYWLGNHKDRDARIWMPGVDKVRLKHMQALSKDANKLALALMDYLFTPEELKEKNCTPAAGKELLSEEKLEGIHCKSYYCTCRKTRIGQTTPKSGLCTYEFVVSRGITRNEWIIALKRGWVWSI